MIPIVKLIVEGLMHHHVVVIISDPFIHILIVGIHLLLTFRKKYDNEKNLKKNREVKIKVAKIGNFVCFFRCIKLLKFIIGYLIDIFIIFSLNIS